MFKHEALFQLALPLALIIIGLVMAFFGPMILRHKAGTPIAAAGMTTTTLLQWDRVD